MKEIMIGWTTVDKKEVAQTLAEALVREKLAACVQIEENITSWYAWEGKVMNEPELRLSVKFPADNAEKIKTWLDKNHPYDTPQWVAVKIEDSLEAYKEWVGR